MNINPTGEIIRAVTKAGSLRRTSVVLPVKEGLQSLGIDKPRLFETLNISALRIITSAALEQLDTFAETLAGFEMATTAAQLYQQVVTGIKDGWLGIGELPVSPLPGPADANLHRLIKANRDALQISSFQALSSLAKIDGRTLEPGITNYVLETLDSVTGFPSTINVTVTENDKATAPIITIEAILSWNSPNLIAKLNRLFGQPWYVKLRPRFTSPSDCRQVSCHWLFGAERTEILKMARFSCFAQLDDVVIFGVNLDFQQVFSADELPRQKEIYDHIEDQIRYSIGTANTALAPWSTVAPDLWWDLGILRNTAAGNLPQP